jgi:hypothetical protein
MLTNFRVFTIAFLLGCVGAVMSLPNITTLGGLPIFVAYPVLGIIGYPLYYLYLNDGYRFGGGTVEWAHYIFGMLPILGVMTLWKSPSKGRTLALGLIGFPVGFIGTLGLYFTAAASI